MFSDGRWVDLRESERDPREIDVRWISLTRDPSDAADVDCRDREPGERDGGVEVRGYDHDPRDPFVHDLELPRDREREFVLDCDRVCELDGEGTRTLAAAGVFRIVAVRDLPFDAPRAVRDLGHQGLVRPVALGGRRRAITLTVRGRRLLERHRRRLHDRYSPDDHRCQAFHSGVSNPRVLTHDAALYRAYLRAEARLRARGATIRRVVQEDDLRRAYQRFLTERSRGRPFGHGRPDRARSEIEAWAREHELPCVDGSMLLPDFRIEFESGGRDGHEDIEVLTAHYTGARLAGRVSCGFTCYSESGRHGEPLGSVLASRAV
jgi:hypothetical protein